MATSLLHTNVPPLYINSSPSCARPDQGCILPLSSPWIVYVTSSWAPPLAITPSYSVYNLIYQVACILDSFFLQLLNTLIQLLIAASFVMLHPTRSFLMIPNWQVIQTFRDRLALKLEQDFGKGTVYCQVWKPLRGGRQLRVSVAGTWTKEQSILYRFIFSHSHTLGPTISCSIVGVVLIWSSSWRFPPATLRSF